MGSSISTDYEKLSDWSIDINFSKGSTNLNYVLNSESRILEKKITGVCGIPICFQSDLDGGLSHGDLPCGSDGDLKDLRENVQNLIHQLSQLIGEDKKPKGMEEDCKDQNENLKSILLLEG
jgi:hypothetical protein